MSDQSPDTPPESEVPPHDRPTQQVDASERRRVSRRGLLAAAGGTVAGVAIGTAGTVAYARAYPWSLSHEIDDLMKAVPPTGATYGTMQVVWNGPGTAKAVALTYDDGPHGEYTPRFLDVLRDHGARATFNVVGTLVAGDADIVKRAADEGHEIGNHSWRHDHFVQRDAAEIARSLTRCADAIEAAIGRRPTWFRPTRGEITGSVLLAAAATGHQTMMWSYTGTLDAPPANAYLRSFTDALAPGMIASYHDGLGSTTFGRESSMKRKLRSYREAELAALPGILAAGTDAGYRFVTMSELIALGGPDVADANRP